MTSHHTAGRARELGVVLLAASVLVSCSGAERRAHVRARVDEILREAIDSPALQAEAARVEAGLAREGEASVLDGINLRVEDVSPRAAELGGRGIDLETRLSIRNPWATTSERRAREAETDEAIAEMRQRALELRAEDCTRDIEAAAHLERQAIFARYEERLRPLLTWSAESRAAGTIDELEAERVALEGERSLEKRRPRFVDVASGGGRPRLSLPPIGREAAPLDSRDETILATIDGRHPEAASMRAAARAYEALSQRARRSRMPWFGFVGLSWEFDPLGSAATIGGEVTVDIPFGLDMRAETDRYDALGRAEEHDADAVVREAATLAREALGQIAAFEESSDRLLALLERADRADAVVERWLGGRLGQPRQVAALLEEAFEVRYEIIEARERAGLAGCVLLEATGIASSQWPRRGREGRAP